MTEAQQLAAGKQWIGKTFERLCCACLGPERLVAWEWQEEDPEYRIRCQVAGHAVPLSIPSQAVGFGRGQLIACGQTDPAHALARQEVEAAIRGRLTALAGPPRC
jgi:hypothetical protein